MNSQFYFCKTTSSHPHGRGFYYPGYCLTIEDAELRNALIDPFDPENPYWEPIYITQEILSGKSKTPYLDFYLLNKKPRR